MRSQRKVKGYSVQIGTLKLKSLKRGLKIHLSWVGKDFGKFKEVYLRYFKLNHEVFIVE
ncbi:MAG: hypothetical protein ACTSRI_16950 [Promethearchaeota archaeon]